MSKSIVKYYSVGDDIEKKIIDSNARIEIKMQEIADAMAREQSVSYDEDEIDAQDPVFEGLDPATLEALTSDEVVAKAVTAEAEAENILKDAREKADEIVATAEQLAQEYKDNSRREAEIEGSRIRNNAKNEGYEAGIREASEEYASKMLEVDSRAKELEQIYEQALNELEPRFVEVITGIYEHIFNVDLSEYQSILADLVCNAMRRAENSGAYIIHVSTQDYPTINDEKREMLVAAASGARVEIVEDIGLGRNQCLLETDNGVLDCGLDTQLRELRKKLMLLSYGQNTET